MKQSWRFCSSSYLRWISGIFVYPTDFYEKTHSALRFLSILSSGLYYLTSYSCGIWINRLYDSADIPNLAVVDWSGMSDKKYINITSKEGPPCSFQGNFWE